MSLSIDVRFLVTFFILYSVFVKYHRLIFVLSTIAKEWTGIVWWCLSLIFVFEIIHRGFSALYVNTICISDILKRGIVQWYCRLARWESILFFNSFDCEVGGSLYWLIFATRLVHVSGLSSLMQQISVEFIPIGWSVTSKSLSISWLWCLKNYAGFNILFQLSCDRAVSHRINFMV
jgi:hypothetical protein